METKDVYSAHANHPSSQMCPICMEAVRFTENRFIWHCKSCYVVTHFQCALSWAKAERISIGGWKCPQCYTIQIVEPKGKCWCDKGSPIYNHPITPNACHGGTCGSASRCPHGNRSFCEKPCHPGPCEYACGACANQAVPKPPNPPKFDTVWDILRARTINYGSILLNVIPVLVVLGGLLTYTAFHIKWHTRPYLDPDFADSFGDIEEYCLILVGLIYIVAGGFFCLYRLRAVIKFYCDVLTGVPGHTRVPFRMFWKVLGVFLISSIFVGAFVVPIIGYVINSFSIFSPMIHVADILYL